jgi:hypothetical protein
MLYAAILTEELRRAARPCAASVALKVRVTASPWCFGSPSPPSDNNWL